MSDSRTGIQKIAAQVSNRPLQPGETAEERKTSARAYLNSMLLSLNGFRNRDEPAIAELKLQLNKLQSENSSADQ